MGASTTTAVSGATGKAEVKKIVAAASTNSTLVKGSPGVIYGYEFSNKAAYAVFVKFYNEATAPTVGTDTVMWTVMVPAGERVAKVFDEPVECDAGIGVGVTKAISETDTTATVADDAHGAVFYA